MDAFDFVDAEKAPPPRRNPDLAWNILTMMVLLVVGCLGIFLLTIFVNPSSGLNPFPPPTLPPTMALPTATATSAIQLPPTWTPEPTLEPTLTFTPRPTSTPFPTETPGVFASATPITATIHTPGAFAFIVQQGSPQAISSRTFHADIACDTWLGIAGQPFALNGSPITQGMIIQLGGTLDGKLYDWMSIVGTAPNYGPAGYEFMISDRLVESSGTLWIQLLGQDFLPMSDKIYFNTYADCEKNLTLMNFVQVK